MKHRIRQYDEKLKNWKFSNKEEYDSYWDAVYVARDIQDSTGAWTDVQTLKEESK